MGFQKKVKSQELKFICGDFSSGDLEAMLNMLRGLGLTAVIAPREDESSKEPEVPAGDSQALASTL